jgi:integrase
MKDVNFYLRPPEKKYKDSNSPIQLQIKLKGVRYWWSTGKSIHKDNWNAAKQRVKDNKVTQASGDALINNALNDYNSEFKARYGASGTIPTVKEMQAHLNAYRRPEELQVEAGKSKFLTLFAEMIEEITVPKTKESHQIVYDHIVKLYDKADFDNMTVQWWNKYKLQLLAGEHNDNGITSKPNNDLAKIAKVWKRAIGGGLKNTAYQNFKLEKSLTRRSDEVALTEDELIKIVIHPFTGKLLEARDFLLVSAFTSLRVSDFKDIKPSDIVRKNGEITFKITTQKTGSVVDIPAHPEIYEIMSRYNTPNNLPEWPKDKIKSESKETMLNRQFKELCRTAGLTERGCLTTEPTKELCDCVKLHTGRRSFATIEYERDSRNLTTKQIMDLMGKEDEKEFITYIRPRNKAATKGLKNSHGDYLKRKAELMAG